MGVRFAVWHSLARQAWVVLVVVIFVLLALGISARHDRMRTICADEDCGYFRVSETTARALWDVGLSLDVYAAYMSSLVVVSVLSCLIGAAVLYWRRSGAWMPLFVAFALVAFLPAYFTSVIEALNRTYPELRLVAGLLQGMGVWFMLVFSCIFPNGRFVPGWTRLLTILATILAISLPIFGPVRLFLWAGSPFDVVITYLLVALLFSAVYAQVYRYRRVSSLVEKQQIKWVVLGFSAIVVGTITYNFAPVVFPILRQPGILEVLYFTIGGTLNTLYLLLLIGSFLLAVLRHHLFDIDVIINRALVYGALSALLVVLYLGSVMVFQQIFRFLTAQESTLALIISTLATAAAFRPLQDLVQAQIDRRFYRQKYDADQVLTAFSETLRHEVDLDALAERMGNVVEKAMQPTHVSLWLRNGVTPREANPIHEARDRGSG